MLYFQKQRYSAASFIRSATRLNLFPTKIAGKTFITYICFYVVAAALAGAAAYFVKTMGWFDVQLPNEMVTEAVTREGYNPLVTVM